MPTPFKNWSGSVQFSPQEIKYPKNEAEIVKIVQQANEKQQCVRLVGSGHSFTSLIETGNILMSLDDFQGIVSTDKKNLRATAYAGTKLKTLGEQLFQAGMAQENLGDIDVQSLAGAISTGTHGTGTTLGTIATQVASLKLVTGTGKVLTCSETENPEIFKAAQISLGSLGIITEIELKLQPAYKLKYVSQKGTLDDALDNLDTLNQNRNFEMYWFPYTNGVQKKEINITEESPKGNAGVGKWFNEMFMENGVFWGLSKMSKYIPGMYKPVSKLSAWGVTTGTTIDWSHRIFATKRLVRFHEMEYNIPVENFRACVEEMKSTIEKENFRVHFPVELRFVKEDDIWLSPCYGRESAYIAVHMYRGMPYKPYFEAMEAIFKRYGGRPHWGKRHFLTADDLAERYPKWEDFHRIRKSLDPNGIFLNDYLRGLFGKWA